MGNDGAATRGGERAIMNNTVGDAIKSSCETGKAISIAFSREDRKYLYSVCHTSEGFTPGRTLGSNETPAMIEFIGERRDGRQWIVTMPNA